MIVLPSERSQYHNIFVDKDLSQPNTAFYSYKQLIKIIKQLYSIAVSFLVLKYFKSSFIYISTKQLPAIKYLTAAVSCPLHSLSRDLRQRSI